MRILHLLAPAEVGGLETVVADLARGQAGLGMTVMVATLIGDSGRLGPWAARLEGGGVGVSSLVVGGRNYLAERRLVRRMLERWGPEVVHTHGYRPDVVDAPVARGRGIPTVTTAHGFTGNGMKNRFYEWLQKRAFRRVDAVVAVSRRLAMDLSLAGVPEAKLHIVPNAFSPAVAPLDKESARIELGLDQSRTVVGWIGRLTPEKGPDHMMRAFSMRGDPRAALVMIGEGWMKADLRRLAADLGLEDRVLFPGIVPEASRLLRAFDVLALSSHTEGIPMVLLEAMWAGTPIVARAVGGVPEMLSPQEALLVESVDEEALAEGLRLALSDPDAARTRADRARVRVVRDFSPGPWVARYLDIYTQVRR